MKKNLISMIILALLIVNIVLNCVTMASVVGTNKKTGDLVGNIATAMNLQLTGAGGEEDAAEQVSMADTEVYSLTGSLTMPLARDVDGADAYLMCDIALSMNKKHKDYKKMSEEVSEKEALITDAITDVVSRHTKSECQDDLEKVRDEILLAVQDLFQSDFIYRVAINNIRFGG